MRHHAHSSAPVPAGQPPQQRPDSETLKRLFPYLWQYKWRVAIALSFMVAAKVANVGVPVLLKELVDTLSPQPDIASALLVVFVDCVKELPATLLLRPFNFNTLSTRVYELASLERLGEAAPAALVVTALGLAAVALLARTHRDL